MNKQELFSKLKESNAFWSYESPQAIDDKALIENVILKLNKEEINALFSLFDHDFLKRVWIERCVRQEPYFHFKNLIVAELFGVKEPEKYLKKEARKIQDFFMNGGRSI